MCLHSIHPAQPKIAVTVEPLSQLSDSYSNRKHLIIISLWNPPLRYSENGPAVVPLGLLCIHSEIFGDYVAYGAMNPAFYSISCDHTIQEWHFKDRALVIFEELAEKWAEIIEKIFIKCNNPVGQSTNWFWQTQLHFKLEDFAAMQTTWG